MKQCKTNTGGATRPHPGRRRRAERKRDPLCAGGASRRQVGPQGWAEQGDQQCGVPGSEGAGQCGAPGNVGRPAVGERAVRGARQCGSPGPAVGRASVRGGSKAVFISFFKFNLTFKCNTRACEF